MEPEPHLRGIHPLPPTALPLTSQAMFDTLEADIVILQEAKIQRKDLTDDMVLVPGWDVYLSLPKHKKGELAIAVKQCQMCQPPNARGAAELTMQAILEWPSTRETQRSVPSGPRRASRVCSVHPTHPPGFEISQRTNRSVAIPRPHS